MEIEHINEDTIRVRIGNEDLEARGYTFLDLLGSQKQIETFFYSILEEVDLDNEFQESDAVTFQVMPNNNGLELYISKDENVHENLFTANDLEDSQPDQRYNRFKRLDQNDELTEEALKQEKQEKEAQKQEEKNQKLVIKFKFFEQIIQLARVFQMENDSTSLYEFSEDYYMKFNLDNDKFSLVTPQESRAVILEYGEETQVTADVLDEHGKLLIEDNALPKILYYFK